MLSEIDDRFDQEEDLYTPPKDEVDTILIKNNKSLFFYNLLKKYFSNENNKYIEDASIIHLTGIWTLSSHKTIKLAKKNNKPLIISPQGMLEPWALKNNSWKKRLHGIYIKIKT